jgi:exopolysaccharide biosynthesis polyprenyl glycosylphosphotransferase
LVVDTDIRRGIKQPVKLEIGQGVNRRAIAFLVGDAIALGVAWQIALHINHIFFAPPIPQFDWGQFAGMPGLFWVFAGVTIVVFAWHHFYRFDQEHNFVLQGKVLSDIYLTSLIVSYFYEPSFDVPRSLFLPAWLGSLATVVGMRLVVSLIMDWLHLGKQTVRVFLLSSPGKKEELQRAIEQRSSCVVVGWLPAEDAYAPETIETILHSRVQEVIADGLPETKLTSPLYWQLRSAGISLRLLPSSLIMLHRRGRAEIFAGMPTIRVDAHLFPEWEYFLKRLLDRVGALLGLMFLSPLFVAIALGIVLTSEGGAFYSQERVGLHGKVFRMWKFRTMYANAEQEQAQLEQINSTEQGVLYKVPDDHRITAIGRFLRRTSLDELPQLFNVLLGHMSLVGPRPFSLRDVAKFAPWHHTRHLVIPGITGLWQVSGRSDLSSLDDVAHLDLFYIDHWSLNFDLELLLETVRVVLFRCGAY